MIFESIMQKPFKQSIQPNGGGVLELWPVPLLRAKVRLPGRLEQQCEDLQRSPVVAQALDMCNVQTFWSKMWM